MAPPSATRWPGLSIDAVTGSIGFDANGDAIKSTAYIKQAIDGGFQFLQGPERRLISQY